MRYNYTEDWAYGRYWRQQNITTVSGASAPVRFSYDPGGRSMLHEAELEHRLSLSASTRAVWGLGAKFTEVTSYGQFSTSGWRERFAYRGFGNLEYRPFQSLLLNAGASLEHDSVVGWMFDPRLSVSYHVLPGHTVRFGMSRAHRNPSLYETSGRFERRDSVTGLLDIAYLAQGVEPERIDMVEVGYLAELKHYRASLDVRLFSERVPNYIQILPLPLPASTPDQQDSMTTRQNASLNYATYIYGRADGAANLEKVRIKGYEYQLQWRPFETTRLIYGNALITIEADFTDSSRVADDFSNVPKIANQTRDSAPAHSQSAMLIQKLPFDVTASVMYFRASPMRWRRNGEPIQASERFDWRLGKSFHIGGARGELAYTVQMANESQEGRQWLRIADKVHWLTLRLSY
ncbi:TonB-dependent receptor plug domain-containing protein [Dechloromonas agitata]|uniref:TonB-dependent receptor plug domain-containing protein n=1 Tax=Dechloromonas agitata TaxID=73030 RepID=UPI0004B71ADE|nr:TonB-dependent receptor [Dechloromonas agitata]